MFTTLNTLANGNKTSPKFVDIKKSDINDTGFP